MLRASANFMTQSAIRLHNNAGYSASVAVGKRCPRSMLMITWTVLFQITEHSMSCQQFCTFITIAAMGTSIKSYTLQFRIPLNQLDVVCLFDIFCQEHPQPASERVFDRYANSQLTTNFKQFNGSFVKRVSNLHLK